MKLLKETIIPSNVLLLHEEGGRKSLLSENPFFNISKIYNTSVRSIKALPVILFAKKASFRYPRPTFSTKLLTTSSGVQAIKSKVDKTNYT